MDCIYLDLKKAFDTVPHKTLMWKLEHEEGIGGSILKWMEDFLSNREIKTVIRNIKSSWKGVISGVSQGCVLASIIFAVYVNDMIEGIEGYISIFADDAKLMRRVTNQEDLSYN